MLAVAKKMGISDSIIHTWRAAEKKTKGGEKPASALEEEVESLRRQLRQTEMDRMAEATRYFKKSCRHFQPNDLRLIYQFIKQEEPHFAVRLMCNTLKISKSSYYEYPAGVTFQLATAEQEMISSVQNVFWENRRRYGSRRVQKALQEQGIEVGRHQIR